ncbi:hypothetical protein ABR36_11140 [Enterobacter ludwigii]|nr:hypothetical protein ABR36_11140 [Enterobacter ludwigii]
MVAQLNCSEDAALFVRQTDKGTGQRDVHNGSFIRQGKKAEAITIMTSTMKNRDLGSVTIDGGDAI